ncbi:MAG: hypothetical protein ACRDH8_15015 [Actinomycetota bacterium]|jgi:chromosome segregation ATPase
MRNQDHLRLSSLSEEISGAASELARLRERLADQGTVLGDYQLRMLIAETPLADRHLHIAALDYRRIENEVRRLEASLADLQAERRKLAERLPAAEG